MPAALNQRHPRRRPRAWSAYVFLAPFFALLLVFGIAPLAFSFWVSLHDWNPTSGVAHMKWSGLWAYNFTRQDPYFWAALLRTLAQALMVAIPQHLIAIPLAFVLHMAFKRWQGMLGTLLFLPYMASSAAATSVLMPFFAMVWRAVEWAAAGLSGLPVLGAWIPAPYLWHDAAYTAFAHLWTSVGWNSLLYLMVLNAIPRSHYEAAQLDGAGLWPLFWHIALPVLRPMVFVAFTMGFLRGIQNPSNTWYASNFDPRHTDLPTYIIRTGFWDFDMGLASEMTVVLFAGMVAVVLVLYALLGKNFSALLSSSHLENNQAPLRFSPITRVALKLGLLVALLISVLPVLKIVFNATQLYPESGLSNLRFGDAFQSNLALLLQQQPHFWRNFFNSVYISTLAAAGAALTSGLAGYAFAFLEFRSKKMLYAIVMGVMLFPALLNLIPTVLVMAVVGWLDQARAIWVPASASAFGVFLTRQYLTTSVSKELLEAARVDGASEGQALVRLVLPFAQPLLVTLGLLTFVTVWNNASGALAILKSSDAQMLTQTMATLNGTPLTTATAIATLPALVLFVFGANAVARGMNIKAGPSIEWRNVLQTKTNPQPASAILGADGLRAMACLMVVFHHLSQRLDNNLQTPLVKELQRFVMTGAVGVSSFFVLSGMLLSLPFWNAFTEHKAFPDLFEFARRRAVRIAPGFYASLTLSAIFGVFFVPDAQSVLLRYLSGLSFTSALHYVTMFPAELNGPLWSIGFEVLCYAIMPLGMAALFAWQGHKRNLRAGLFFWLLLLGASMFVHQQILTHLVPDNINRGWEFGLLGGAKYWTPNYNVVGLFAHYALGVLAAGVMAGLRQKQQRAHWGFDTVASLTLVLMMALLWAMRSTPDFSFSIGAQPYFFPSFPMLVALLLITLANSRWIGRILDNAFMRLTAKLSFGLYIWHYLILELIRLVYNSEYRYFGIADLGEHMGISVVALGLAYLAAALSYKHIEAPFLGKRKP